MENPNRDFTNWPVRASLGICDCIVGDELKKGQEMNIVFASTKDKLEAKKTGYPAGTFFALYGMGQVWQMDDNETLQEV